MELGLPFSCGLTRLIETYILHTVDRIRVGRTTMVTVKIPRLKCSHCGHAFVPRKENRKKCPRCQKAWKD